MRMYICTRFKKAMNKIWIPLLQESQKDKIIGLVVQLVRIPACHAGGRGFESRPDRKKLRFLGAFLFSYNWFLINYKIIEKIYIF